MSGNPRKSRAYFTPTAWVLTIDLWQRSGLSRAAFCRRQGIPYEAMGYWVKKFGSSKPVATGVCRGGPQNKAPQAAGDSHALQLALTMQDACKALVDSMKLNGHRPSPKRRVRACEPIRVSVGSAGSADPPGVQEGPPGNSKVYVHPAYSPDLKPLDWYRMYP